MARFEEMTRFFVNEVSLKYPIKFLEPSLQGGQLLTFNRAVHLLLFTESVILYDSFELIE